MEARERGATAAELSRYYGISAQNIFKLQARYCATGSMAAQTHLRGRKPQISEKELQQIDEALQRSPDLTLEKLREELQLPIQVSHLSQIAREKLGYTYKKDGSRQRTRQT